MVVIQLVILLSMSDPLGVGLLWKISCILGSSSINMVHIVNSLLHLVRCGDGLYVATKKLRKTRCPLFMNL